uniref:Uncharacterized protein n=1 Tax=Dulem virus 42 TaxID=3145760 RepID=A0AAU8B807_9CAUD
MKEQHHSAIGIGKDIMWIDVINKAVLVKKGDTVTDYGELTNVQSILNRMSEDVPDIEYDLQNQELLCKCFDDDSQLVFNAKINIATSIYTREYDDIILYNNILYGLSNKGIRRFTFLKKDDIENEELLKPTELKFSVNSSPSITKTFDTQ